MLLVRLIDRVFGRSHPVATLPEVEPFATRDEDGTITLVAIVPKLDPKTVRIDRLDKGHFVVRGRLGTVALAAVALTGPRARPACRKSSTER